MITRLSTSQIVANGLYSITKNQNKINDLMSEIATGKKQNTPIIDKIQAEQYSNDISNITQYLTNGQRIEPQLKEQENALTELTELFTNLKELSIEIRNPSTFNKKIHQLKLNSLKDQIQGIMNTQDTLGNYVFSGTLGNKEPFPTLDNYQGDLNVRNINLDKNINVSVNIPGSKIIDSNFNNFINKIQNFIDTQNYDVTLVSDINNSIDNLSSNKASIGFSLNKIDTFKNLLNNEKINKQVYSDNLTDANIESSISQLTQAQTAYQAALKSYSVIQNMSLFNYI